MADVPVGVPLRQSRRGPPAPFNNVWDGVEYIYLNPGESNRPYCSEVPYAPEQYYPSYHDRHDVPYSPRQHMAMNYSPVPYVGGYHHQSSPQWPQSPPSLDSRQQYPGSRNWGDGPMPVSHRPQRASMSKSSASLPQTLTYLHNTLLEAKKFYAGKQKEFKADTEKIREYASEKVLMVLWTAKQTKEPKETTKTADSDQFDRQVVILTSALSRVRKSDCRHLGELYSEARRRKDEVREKGSEFLKLALIAHSSLPSFRKMLEQLDGLVELVRPNAPSNKKFFAAKDPKSAKALEASDAASVEAEPDQPESAEAEDTGDGWDVQDNNDHDQDIDNDKDNNIDAGKDSEDNNNGW